MSNSKKHYHLVAGEVKFGNTTDETIGSTLLNALLPWDAKHLPLRAIGRAQQALQIQFRNRIQNDPANPTTGRSTPRRPRRSMPT